MDIENTVIHGQAGIEFTDRTGTPCTLWILENIKNLRFDLDTDFSQFSQEDIRTLLPYLQAYVETGTFELREAGTDIVDQGKHIEGLEKEKARMNVRNYRYEQLLKEWKKYGQPSSDSKSPDELIHMTDQLMEESARSVEGVNDLEKAKKAKAYYMRQCDQQVDHIANLEELLEEWSKFASEATMIHPPYMIHQIELQKKTTQLLGEDQ